MKELIRNLVEDLLPGSGIDEKKADSTIIRFANKEKFRQLTNDTDGDPKALILGVLAVELATGRSIRIIPINKEAIGEDKGQGPFWNIPYAILHELVELRVIDPPEEVKQAARNIRLRTAIPEVSDFMRFWNILHLTALCAEYTAALQIPGTKREKKIELGRYHRTVNKAKRERTTFDPDYASRLAAPREILKINNKNWEE